jgi:hypothetical protein
MYIAVVALTTLILPVGSVLLAGGADPAADLSGLVGLWFIVWGVASASASPARSKSRAPNSPRATSSE